MAVENIITWGSISLTVLRAFDVSWWIKPAYWTVVELSNVVRIGIPAVRRQHWSWRAKLNEESDFQALIIKGKPTPYFSRLYLLGWRQWFRLHPYGLGFSSRFLQLPTETNNNGCVSDFCSDQKKRTINIAPNYQPSSSFVLVLQDVATVLYRKGFREGNKSRASVTRTSGS